MHRIVVLQAILFGIQMSDATVFTMIHKSNDADETSRITPLRMRQNSTQIESKLRKRHSD